MFGEDIKYAFNNIAPSERLVSDIAAMMREEAAKPRRPVFMNAARVAAMAAAACVITGLSVAAVGLFGGGIEMKDNNASLAAHEPAEAEQNAKMFAADEAAPFALNAETYSEEAPEAGFFANDALESEDNSVSADEASEEEFFTNEISPNEELSGITAESSSEKHSNASAAADSESDGAYGGDGTESQYRISVTWQLDNIPGEIADIVGIDAFAEWEKETRFDPDMHDFTDIDRFINLYSFKKHFGMTDAEMEAALLKMNERRAEWQWEPYLSEEEIAVIAYGTKDEVSEYFANSFTVYHNGRLYTVQWFDLHTPEDYAAEGIPPEKIKEKAANMMYLRNFRNPETRESFDLSSLAEKLSEYIGEKIEP